MPFTVSHVAAVLPLRRWLRPAGLLPSAAIGAMAPDFGLFLPLWMPRSATHGTAALVVFCLPVGLLAWLLFERVLRPALVAVVPDAWWAHWAARGAPPAGALRTWLGAGAAVLAGASTHVAWDAFTHEGARGVEMLPVLDRPAWQVNGHPMLLYRMLQHLSSVAGLALVLWALWRWHRSLPRPAGAPVRPLGRRERLLWVACCALLPLAATLGAAVHSLYHGEAFYASSTALARVAKVALAATGTALVLVSALLRLRLRRRARG